MHEVALPYHYGKAGVVCGGAANDLLSISGEPNVTIMKAKALTCNIVPGRLPRGRALAEFLNKCAPQAGLTNLHQEDLPAGAQTGGKFSRSQGGEGKTE